MYCACTSTVTGEEELIVVSGKLNGFALIVTPLIRVTLIAEGGVAGAETERGTDVLNKLS